MRIFETITILLVLGIMVERIMRFNRPFPLIEYAVVIPAVLHIILEGARWQMFGIYAVIVLMILTGILNLTFFRKYSLPNRKWTYIAGIAITVFSLMLVIAFPVKNIPEPTGPYNVGTTTYDLNDESRIEIYGDRKGDTRKFRVQLWYPTDSDEKGDIAPWIEDGTVVPENLMSRYGVPPFIYNHITLADSNSYKNAPLSSEVSMIPVVVISHGWTGFRNLHTDLGELFASMGYLAIGIDHTYGSIGLVFEDGDEAPLDPSALPGRDETDSFYDYAQKLVDTYSEDTGFVLSHIKYLNDSSDLFRGKIDLEHIGVIGHSTGGGGVVKQAMQNPDVSAVVGLDPWVEPIGMEMLSDGLDQPALFFRSTSWTGGINDDFISVLAANASSHITSYEISGSKHQDFSMLYHMGPLPRLLGMQGDLYGYESASIQQSFIYNFLNHHLKGAADGTDNLMNQYESVFEVEYPGISD